jgi:hypothetical protein
VMLDLNKEFDHFKNVHTHSSVDSCPSISTVT